MPTQGSPADHSIAVDVLIYGGGVAGLWVLDEVRRAGYQALLIEAEALGAGQTIASQGIIHGGLKYTLDGLFNPAAEAIREMPQVWRECLAGRRAPQLGETRVRAEFCHLWRTNTLASRAGMIGARVGLRVRPQKVAVAEWPEALRGLRGEVLRLDEIVLDPASLLRNLAQRNAGCLLRGEPGGFKIEARTTVLCAGAGNAALRARRGLPASMQERPLHMVMARGTLPLLNGHCTDGARTRVTITSDRDAAGRTVWQIGGEVAEAGVAMSRDELIRHAQREIAACVPWMAADRGQAGVEWATHRVSRAEAASGGRRPDDVSVLRDGAVIAAWPTKLALAPRLAQRVLEMLPPPQGFSPPALPPDVARPEVARPPWEVESDWRCGD